MKIVSSLSIIFLILLIGLKPIKADAPCGNNSHGGPGSKGGPDNDSATKGENDPFNPYTGNEYREVPDLKIWGGIGEHQLVWERWANSRYINGPKYFGSGHNWRHSYQWDMADAPSTDNFQKVEIITPDGSDNIFTHDPLPAQTWHPLTGITDLLTQSNNDFYLQRQNGWVYHFVKNVTNPSKPFYLMVDFKDSAQNQYNLTYNSLRQVVQVSEPGGRSLQIEYTGLSLNKIDFATIIRLPLDAPDDQYVELSVNETRKFRYLRYLGADGQKCNISEVEFYDQAGNKLAGTPFGTNAGSANDYSKAFDGNPATFSEDPRTTGGYCGIDLGPGKTAIVGKVRFLARAGHSVLQGRFQGSNQAPSSISVISRVKSSDGRVITYNYKPFNDEFLPYVYQVLSSVNYDDGKIANYDYQQVFPTSQPLVVSFNDPRYELPFTQTKTIYYNTNQSPVGQIYQQLNAKTGESLGSLVAYLGNLGKPAVLRSNGSTHIIGINHADGANTFVHDGNDKKTAYSYDARGYKSAIVDRRYNLTTMVKSAFANPNQIVRPGGAKISYARDSLDLPTAFTDELGRKISIARDASHRPTQIAYPDQSAESFAYNQFGQVTRQLQRNGGTASAAYDPTGLKTQTTDALGNVTNYTYDQAGRVSSTTDARGNATSYQYDFRGQVTQVTYADGSTHRYTYDDYGNALTDTDELEHTTSSAYDIFNRRISSTDPLGRTTIYRYRSGYYVNNKPDQVIEPSGKITAYTYDGEDHALTRTVGFNSPDAATTRYVYDNNYNVIQQIDPNGQTWNWTYDARDRKTSATDPLGHQTQFIYDAASNLIRTTRPDGGVTTNVYDSMHRLTKTTNPKGEVTQMSYDASSNLVSTTDARGNTYKWTYDLLNRKTAMTYPDGSRESYSYDAVGNLVSYVTRAGQTKTSTFDSRNRETGYTWSDTTPAVSRLYDAAGRLLSSANGLSTCTYRYDQANQLTSETQTIAGLGTPYQLSYAYDADGNRTSLIYPSGTVVGYTYTGRNQINSVQANGEAVANYAYDANGNVTGKSLSNGTLSSYSYDPVNRLTSLVHSLNSNIFLQFDYGYDAVNRRTFEKRDQTKGDAYSYDAIDQVTGVNYEVASPDTGPAGALRTVAYQYDATGNRTAMTDSTAGTTIYNANNLNQYTNVGGVDYSSDANGNLARGNGFYFYDAQNRLVSAQKGGLASPAETFGYDSRNRVAKRLFNNRTLYLIYDGWDLIEERDGGGALIATYIHGVRQDELILKASAHGNVYYHHNALGNVTALTDETGAVVETYKYDTFGRATIADKNGVTIEESALGNRFLFTGREYLAEVGLYDYRNRVYSLELGRFLQSDPIDRLIQEFLNTQKISEKYVKDIDADSTDIKFRFQWTNAYLNCENDAINKIDLFGLDWVYSQSTGSLTHRDNTGENRVGTGYAGHGEGLNNPDKQNVPNVGPLPQGDYTIGRSENNPATGPVSLRLTPSKDNNMHGRGDFLIHGDNSKGDHSASQGCIILPRNVREQINNSNDKKLYVVP